MKIVGDLTSHAGIYCIRNTVNGKTYIGSAVNLRRRFVEHCRMLDGGKHHSGRLQNAWAKYGPAVFEFDVIESGMRSADLLVREQHYLDLFDSARPSCGYNIAGAAGSVFGMRHSPDAKERIAAGQRGRTRSVATRAKMAEAKRAEWARVPESARRAWGLRTRAKMGPSVIARVRDTWAAKSPAEMNAFRNRVSSARQGWVATPEYRAAMSAAKRGRPLSAAHRAALSVAARRRGAILRSA